MVNISKEGERGILMLLLFFSQDSQKSSLYLICGGFSNIGGKFVTWLFCGGGTRGNIDLVLFDSNMWRM